MHRYHLSKLKANREYGCPENNKAYIGLATQSEDTLSRIQVQQTNSRDEVETLAESKPENDDTRDPSVQVETSPPTNVDPNTLKVTQKRHKGIVRKIRKLSSALVKKTVRRLQNKGRMIAIPGQETLLITEHHSEMSSLGLVKSSVHVASTEGSVSTLSHAEALPIPAAKDTENLLEDTESGPIVDPDLEEFDLSFDETSFPNSRPQEKVATQDNQNKTLQQASQYGPTDIWSACRTGDEGFIRGALAHNHDILMQTHQGRTPLYCAAHAGHAHIVKLLLELGATDNDGTAHLSALNNDCKMLLATARRKAQPNRSEATSDKNMELEKQLHNLCSVTADESKSIVGLVESKRVTSDTQVCETRFSPMCVISLDSPSPHGRAKHSYHSFGLDNGTTDSAGSEILAHDTASTCALGAEGSSDGGSRFERSHTDSADDSNSHGHGSEAVCEEEPFSSMSSSESIESTTVHNNLTEESSTSMSCEQSRSDTESDAYACDWHLGMCQK
jgi:hypothetical protein